MEFLDEQSATVAKDALHNYKLDGENKIKVRLSIISLYLPRLLPCMPDHFRKEVVSQEKEATLVGLPSHIDVDPVSLLYRRCILVPTRNVLYVLSGLIALAADIRVCIVQI